MSVGAPDLDAASQSLLLLDQVLSKKPKKDDEALTELTRQLCIVRDQLIACWSRPSRTPEDQRRLDHINAIISIVASVHFPLGEAPWEDLEKARNWLAELTSKQPTGA